MQVNVLVRMHIIGILTLLTFLCLQKHPALHTCFLLGCFDKQSLNLAPVLSCVQ